MFPTEFLLAVQFSSEQRECVHLLGQPKGKLGSQPAGEDSPGCSAGRDDSEGLLTLKHFCPIWNVSHLKLIQLESDF